jgi:hypothetical protein
VRRKLLVLGLILFGVGGCGATPLSVTQLRSSAARICSLARRQTDRIAAPASPDGTSAFLKRGIAVLKPELSQLRALQPPHQLADEYATSTSAFSQKLGALDGTVHSLAGGADPTVAIKLLQQQLTPIEAREDGAWEALEIPACVNR